MIIAHTLIDAVAFIGYALLVGHVSCATEESFQMRLGRPGIIVFCLNSIYRVLGTLQSWHWAVILPACRISRAQPD